MPKHRKVKTSAPSPLEAIRSDSAYGSARTFVSLPFAVMAVLYLVGAALSVLSLFSSGEFNWMAVLPLGICLLVGLTCCGIVALGGALFDLADCAVRAEARAKSHEAREAYKNYQAEQLR
jgi:hypothetical protein